MLHFTRFGPRLLRLEGEPSLADWLLSRFEGAQPFETWADFDHFEGNVSAVICIDPEQQERKVMVPASTGGLLAEVINAHCCGLVTQVHRLPRIQLFRLSGDPCRGIAQLADRFGGVELPLDRLFDPVVRSGLSVCFTDRSLRNPVQFSTLRPTFLRLVGDPEKLSEALQRQALELFNASLGDRTWHALEIRIYDIYNRYDVHRRRLVHALEDLDLGLILGEGWGRDWARVLMALDVYCVKLYTFLPPEEVKRRLIGLEWDQFGNRLADYDLFEGRKKISWGSVKGDVKADRATFSASCRSMLFSLLSDKAQRELLDADIQLRAREKQLGGTPKES